MMHYLDSAATTRTSAIALDAAIQALKTDFGNPSSGHAMGQNAYALLESSREAAAAACGAPAKRIFFTSGGTEANNITLRGIRRPPGRSFHIVTTALEHPSVLKTLEAMSGPCQLTAVPPRADGRVSPGDILAAVREDTGLVSCNWVCGETGAVTPLAEISKGLGLFPKRPLLHVDGVQGFGKLKIDLSLLGVDIFTFSGHKIHAPKGAGGFYLREGVRLSPLFTGGGQEGGLRPGTENLPAIAGLGAICAAGHKWTNELKLLLLERLALLPKVTVIPPHDAPHIVCFSLEGYPAQVVQRFLSDRGIYLSVGSACSKGKRSPALTAMRLPPRIIDSALRCSFSRDSTVQDVDALIDGLKAAIAELVSAVK